MSAWGRPAAPVQEPAEILQARAKERVQCRYCRWHGQRQEMAGYRNQMGQNACCPECQSVNLHFLRAEEQPLPPHPLPDETRAWLKAGGFVDHGLKAGKRVFLHQKTRHHLMVQVPGNATPEDVLNAVYKQGRDDQKADCRQPLQRFFEQIRAGGKPLPVEAALMDMLVPGEAEDAESQARRGDAEREDGWELLREGDER